MESTETPNEQVGNDNPNEQDKIPSANVSESEQENPIVNSTGENGDTSNNAVQDGNGSDDENGKPAEKERPSSSASNVSKHKSPSPDIDVRPSSSASQPKSPSPEETPRPSSSASAAKSPTLKEDRPNSVASNGRKSKSPPPEMEERPASRASQSRQSKTPSPTDDKRPASVSSKGRKSNSPPPEHMGRSSPSEIPKQDAVPLIPAAPSLPSPESTQLSMGPSSTTNTALNMSWSFGLNRNVPVLNLTDDNRTLIMYACAHAGIIYDYKSNKQHTLQGHSNPITCTCVSEDKRWLATGDKGTNSMVIIWDTYNGIPVQTLFDPNPNSSEGGVVSIAMTKDARYLATLSSGACQNLTIWDWTVDGDTPMCTAELSPNYGLQNYILFNPEDIHYVVTNSDSQVIFYHWNDRNIEYFAPPLTDQDFNKPVGRFHQSIFQSKSSRSLTATSIGNLVVWDNNKPLTKVVSSEPSADKKALKIIKVQDRGIDVLTTTDKFIVVGDVAGHVKFFDQSLKLVNWYQDFHLGPVNSISFSHVPEFTPLAKEGSNFPPDATITAKKFVIRDFVVGSSIAVVGNITTDGTKVDVTLREHDAAIHALAAHPTCPQIAVGSYSGLLKIWNYEKKDIIVSRVFDRGNLIRCCTYDPKGAHLAIGFVNGCVRILDAITLEDEIGEPYRFSREAITHITFSLDSQYLATGDADYAVSLYKKQKGSDVEPYFYIGRYRAHYKPIKDIMFGKQLDSNQPRLLSLGEDRVLVEYDLDDTDNDHFKLASTDRIEQSAVPLCMAWYPPLTKEHFILTANDQYKFKLYNTTTKMCRHTFLGPTYGSPIQKIQIIPTENPHEDKRYLAYITSDKVGINKLALDGNPHNAMALIAHPAGVANMVCSYDGKCLFTAGGSDATVHMWDISFNALEAQSNLGGEGLIPFYGLLEGGRDGELYAELEDYFYYAQIRSQGVNSMGTRQVSVKIPLTEVQFVMRAMGFYPSEQEIEDMLNEVKFSQYVETGKYIEEIDLGDFIKLYINHRPAFGLSPDKILEAFQTLGLSTNDGVVIERGELLDLLQSKGEHMTEYELAEYLTTLLGFNAEGGSSELQEFDPGTAGDIIDQNLPHQIDSEMFSNKILGFAMYGEEPLQNSDSFIAGHLESGVH